MINSFQNENRFLSNFYPSKIQFVNIWGEEYEAKSVEHAYQAMKAISKRDFEKVLNAKTPSDAKKLGRRIEINPNWGEMKYDVMIMLIYHKFSQNPDLANQLLDTGNQFLVEGNTWGDTF